MNSCRYLGREGYELGEAMRPPLSRGLLVAIPDRIWLSEKITPHKSTRLLRSAAQHVAIMADITV